MMPVSQRAFGMRRCGWLVLLGMSGLAAALAAAEPALTIYNRNFAVVRDRVNLDLKEGLNDVRVTDITAHLEPDSVILRDPAGKQALQIVEQNYRADPISDGLLLSLNEGKEIEFLNGTNIVRGKIVRSGYVPHQSAMSRYGREYSMRQGANAYGPGGQPIIEVDGQLRFSLPGLPLFPSLADDTILKPTIQWILQTNTKGKFDAELSYVTGGMSWEADYNLVGVEKGDTVDVIGWVTMDNQSGKTFRDARIKLMAGDVGKIQGEEGRDSSVYASLSGVRRSMAQPVSEKAFDEYHLYTLNRMTTLRDRETKQVEFIRAAGVKSARVYVYNGARIDQQRYRGYSWESIREQRDYGVLCNPKVWVMREFKNNESNHLGLPLPAGRLRFYSRDEDGRIEFTGESLIDHTAKDELVRVYTGNAFDLVGERRRVDYRIDSSKNWLDESFEIKVRNHKEKDTVEVRIVENLYRWPTWEIVEKSNTFLKTDSNTVEFRVQLAPGEEKVVTYKVHYTW